MSICLHLSAAVNQGRTQYFFTLDPARSAAAPPCGGSNVYVIRVEDMKNKLLN